MVRKRTPDQPIGDESLFAAFEAVCGWRPPEIVGRREDGREEVRRAPPRTPAPEAATPCEILRSLGETGRPTKALAVARRIGRNHANVRTCLAEMRDRGLVARNGDGGYRLTWKGRLTLECRRRASVQLTLFDEELRDRGRSA